MHDIVSYRSVRAIDTYSVLRSEYDTAVPVPGIQEHTPFNDKAYATVPGALLVPTHKKK